MRTKAPPNLADVLATDPTLARLSLGLRRTGLLFELVRAPAFTVVAPHDDAFDRLGLPFVELIHSPERVEERFALFEHLVVLCTPDDLDRSELHTVGGNRLTLGSTQLRGASGTTARVLGVTSLRGGRLVRTRDLLLPPNLALAA
jgi:hypothetical protein